MATTSKTKKGDGGGPPDATANKDSRVEPKELIQEAQKIDRNIEWWAYLVVIGALGLSLVWAIVAYYNTPHTLNADGTPVKVKVSDSSTTTSAADTRMPARPVLPVGTNEQCKGPFPEPLPVPNGQDVKMPFPCQILVYLGEGCLQHLDQYNKVIQTTCSTNKNKIGDGTTVKLRNVSGKDIVALVRACDAKAETTTMTSCT